MVEDSHILIDVKAVKKFFKKNDRQELLVLDDVNLKLKEGEIVALLGKSGSGKSTLLRIIAGLTRASSGSVHCGEQEVLSPVPGVSMVFQNFALMPWLTVLQNVELGLEAQGVGREERRSRALKAIDTVGLDGFESAYPKELSGGMCQRVGFARAMVVNPDVLLMDEPFSALDVLTAENLRNDLIDLWRNNETSIKSILIVTHNIEEAAFLADRILIFSTNPGKIRSEISVDLPHPRMNQSREFRALVNSVYTAMTASEGAKYKAIDLGYRLPKITISELAGFIETLSSPEYEKRVDLPELSEELHLDVDDLFPITEMLEIVRFASVSDGDIELMPAAHDFINADILERKQIFAKHLLQYVPLVRHIRVVLDGRPGHRASKQRFLGELEDYLSEDAAEEVLTIAIDWARYAEVFAYDFNTGVLSLENPQ